MLPEPKRLEIDHRTIKLLVGLIALSLATLASTLSGPPPIASISASYHAGGPARAVMFVILAVFCLIFRSRALAKGYRQAKLRAATYAVCAGAIVLSIGVIALDHLLDGSITASLPRLTFLGENLALVAFGVAWLVASRVLPFISSSEERFSPFTGREGR